MQTILKEDSSALQIGDSNRGVKEDDNDLSEFNGEATINRHEESENQEGEEQTIQDDSKLAKEDGQHAINGVITMA